VRVLIQSSPLTNINTRYLGYKLRKHIATALRARSQAIRSALDRYNAAASAVCPPRLNLSWNDVVEYAFLADFDLLRDSRQDVRDRPWTKPAYRVVIDHHFKLERAREEIQRLNIEIRRVITYIRDEDLFLRLKEGEVREANPGLACQVKIYRMERGRFNEQHMQRFRKLASLPGFTGSIRPGTSAELRSRVGNPMDVDEPADDDGHRGESDDSGGDGANNSGEGDEDDEDDQEDEDIQATVAALMSLTLDAPGVE
jgi:hypothetical protein